MEGKVRVSSVQMHVVDNDLEANMKKAEEMAMRIHDREKDVDLILYHECCLEGGIPLDSIDEDMTRRVMEFWSNLAKNAAATFWPAVWNANPRAFITRRRSLIPRGKSSPIMRKSTCSIPNGIRSCPGISSACLPSTACALGS